MRTQMIKVAPDVREVLRRAEIDTTAKPIRLTLQSGTLDRKLYVAVDEVLRKLGGRWDRTRAAHVFESGDPSAQITAIVDGRQAVDKKKTYQAFFTPDEVADRVVNLAGLGRAASVDERRRARAGGREVCHVLEPSAGDGALCRALRRESARLGVTIHITANDTNPDHYKALQACANTVLTCDFLGMSPTVVEAYDRIVMNPPFTRGQDVAHVLHAFKFLRPGGLLVAITSPAFKFRTGAKWDEFRKLYDEHGVETIDLPAGAFRESGTNAATVIVVFGR